MNIRISFMARCALVAAGMLVNAVLAAAPIAVFPAAPRAFESVQLRAEIPGQFVLASRPTLSMAANKISVSVEVLRWDLSNSGGTLTSVFNLGQLPAGQYSVEFKLGAASTDISSASFTVSDTAGGRIADYPGYNFTDLWWNSNESGWGVSIHVKNDSLFAAWFVYDQTGRAQWYTIQTGTWSIEQASAATVKPITYVYTGKVYKTSGPVYGGIDTLVGPLIVAEVGTASIKFTSSGSATFAGTVEGKSFSKQISRQAF